MNNKDKIILDLCGGTGAWSRPYKDNGYDVHNITTPEYDVNNYYPPINVYGILAAPPCTMFSIARTKAKSPRSFETGMILVIACLDIIWKCQYKNKLKFWCLENPKGYLRQFLGIPAFKFFAYEFSHPWSKPTDLWGYFKIPNKYKLSLKNMTYNNYTTNIGGSNARKKINRSITPSGFANAFFKANR